MLSTQHGMQEQGQNPEKVTLYIIVVGEENYGNGRGQQVKTLCDRTNHTLDYIGLVVRLFPSLYASNCQQWYHLRGREALQQSRQQRLALTGSWLSHVPGQNLCIPRMSCKF